MTKTIKDLSVDKIRIITVGKVASSAFKHSLGKDFKVSHRHSLNHLREVLEKDQDTLIIAGIRNPLKRNLSYFFQTYSDQKNTDVVCKGNKYKGDKCFVVNKEKLIEFPPKKICSLFFKQKWHYIFNDWFEEFFELTYVTNVSFDKSLGYQIYCLNPSKNIWLLFYTFEKLEENTHWMENFFGISELKHTNNAKDRIYKDVYRDVRDMISFPKSYKQKLLNTDTVRHFYSAEDIEQFYSD